MLVPRWSIVLAGGEGMRLRSYVERRFGEPRPKQYCAFSGRRSMLEHTLRRAAALTGETRTVTVVSSSHERWAQAQLGDHPGIQIAQRENRETGPGVYLPLAYVRAHDPDAVVYILPSDHFIRPADRFADAVMAAGDLAERHPGRIVLTGVVPERVDTEYGYIEPGDPLEPGSAVRGVARFVEKPTLDGAALAIARGAVWNTMIIAASGRALWDAGRACIPDVIARFDELVAAIGTPHEADVLTAIYRDMPVANFSRDVLEHVTERCLVTPLPGVEWSDWGVAARIEATLARLAPAGPRVRARTAPIATNVAG